MKENVSVCFFSEHSVHQLVSLGLNATSSSDGTVGQNCCFSNTNTYFTLYHFVQILNFRPLFCIKVYKKLLASGDKGLCP